MGQLEAGQAQGERSRVPGVAVWGLHMEHGRQQGQCSTPLSVMQIIKLLERAGFKILLLPSLNPAYVTSKQLLAHVYYDQYMKFWLWNKTEYEYIVYIDSYMFFWDPSTTDFPAYFAQVGEELLVACQHSGHMPHLNACLLHGMAGFLSCNHLESCSSLSTL